MLRFECDYGEGAAPAVLELLQKTNFDQTPGYGEDEYCATAAAQITRLCDAPDADVHFFVGATQANLTVIAAALKPWQGVLCADSGHIHVHETGSIEATGHKCLALPGKNGKITARQVRKAVEEHLVPPQQGRCAASRPYELRVHAFERRHGAVADTVSRIVVGGVRAVLHGLLAARGQQGLHLFPREAQ